MSEQIRYEDCRWTATTMSRRADGLFRPQHSDRAGRCGTRRAPKLSMMHAARRIWLATIAIAAFAGPSVADDALGQPAPARVALVIGNTAYTLAPALPACAASANLVADRLKAAGFDVDERLDATNGPMGAALIAFDRAVAIHPGTAAVVYFCGYAVNYQDRNFVLPVSAALNRPSDALTEGVVARALGAAGAGSVNVGPALVLLDLFGLPNDKATAPTATLAQESTNGRLAIAPAGRADHAGAAGLLQRADRRAVRSRYPRRNPALAARGQRRDDRHAVRSAGDTAG